MKFSLIICTYMRPQSLLNLLNSVRIQTIYPDEIIIVDGSTNNETEIIITENHFQNLKYFKVDNQDRGLTKQRNFGIDRVYDQCEIVCFLDDDTILDKNYFQEVVKTYKEFPKALGVGGYITNEVHWTFKGEEYLPKINEFYFDGWTRLDGSRFVLRKKLGLDSDRDPGCLPEFSNGRSIGFLPPSGKIYQVEQLMGGVSSFRKEVFDTLKFSTYFEGYGLYEDADFTLRLSKLGELYVNTRAILEHYHHPSGRPNHFRYGKMVVRNGWYVWRVKFPNPTLKAKLKWHAITILLTVIRASNVVNKNKRKEAFTEALGRIVGWFSIFVKKTNIVRFAIFSHVEHRYEDHKYYGYGPYIKEMNIWLKYVDQVDIIAPLKNQKPNIIDLNYEHSKINFSKIPSFNFTNKVAILNSFFVIPFVLLKIFMTMRKADHIHLRCPGNVGLLACLVQILFPWKKKTAKYAGNWDPKSKHRCPIDCKNGFYQILF